MRFATGTLTWLEADAIGTVYTVSGLGFTPSAIMLTTSGSGVDNTTADDRRGIGFIASTSDRRCVGGRAVNASAAMDTQQYYRTDAVLAQISAAAAFLGLLDINTIVDGGFTLMVDQRPTGEANMQVHWSAWGGTDLPNVATGEISEPAATGNVDYTVTGSFQPSVVLIAGSQVTGAANSAAANDMGLCFGAATASGAGNQWVFSCNQDEGSAASDADRYCRSDECLAMMTVAGGNPSARANFQQFNTTGFRLNWIARATTARKYIYLAIGGGFWKAGTYTIDSSSSSNTAAVTGLAFTPIGAIHAFTRGAENVAGTSVTESMLGIGSSQFAIGGINVVKNGWGVWDVDATANATIRVSVGSVSALTMLASAGGIPAGSYSVLAGSFTRTGFTVDIDSTSGVTTEMHGYLTFGGASKPCWPLTPRFYKRKRIAP